MLMLMKHNRHLRSCLQNGYRREKLNLIFCHQSILVHVLLTTLTGIQRLTQEVTQSQHSDVSLPVVTTCLLSVHLFVERLTALRPRILFFQLLASLQTSAGFGTSSSEFPNKTHKFHFVLSVVTEVSRSLQITDDCT